MRGSRIFGQVLLVVALSLGWPGAARADGNYAVQPGDTLALIAHRFGTSIDALITANGIDNPNLIFVGQQLVIPGAEAASAEPAPAPSQAARVGLAGEGSILAGRRVVTYYGNPWAAQMGILGELDKDALVRELQRQAAVYEQIGGKPVQPAIHLIATVAQASPGADGLYRLRMPASMIEEYADLAAQNGMLLILDLQVGRSTVADELEPVRPFLRRPNVHLALDPEFDMKSWQEPGVQLGSTTASDINYAVRTLAEIAEADGLPNKILIVHQFAASMIQDKPAIQDHPRVDLVIDMDGFGGQGIKLRHYEWYVRDEAVEFAGIKLFLKHDTNLLSPEELLGLDPPPDVIIYQ